MLAHVCVHVCVKALVLVVAVVVVVVIIIIKSSCVFLGFSELECLVSSSPGGA